MKPSSMLLAIVIAVLHPIGCLFWALASLEARLRTQLENEGGA
jgi:hypothetical protein